MFALISDTLGPATIIYGFAFLLMLVQVFAMLFVPSILHKGKPMEVGKAIYCYILQIIGIFLMSVSGLAALHGALGGQLRSSVEYLALLIVFAAGGVLFLWHEMMISSIDAASRAVPAAIYWFMVRLLG